MEATANLVVEATLVHPAQAQADGLPEASLGRSVQVNAFPYREQEVQSHRRGELGRRAEAAIDGISIGEQGARGAESDGGIGLAGLACRGSRLVEEVAGDGLSIAFQLGPPQAEMIGDPHEHLGPGCAPSPVVGWEVGATEEGSTIRQTEAVQGPPTLVLDHLHGVHVELIDIWAFLSVDLDADEVAVHQVGDPGVIEALA
jgi:hypothetical protein